MKIRSLLFFLTFSFCAFAQKMPSDYFMEAIQYGQSGQNQKALENFLYIVENHPRNELYPKALYNVGFIYFQQKEYEKSIFYCWKLMTGGFNDTEELGGDIMAESYTNYSHLACVRISECYNIKAPAATRTRTITSEPLCATPIFTSISTNPTPP